MENEDWISIEDSLPGINKPVNIKSVDKNGNEYIGTAEFIKHKEVITYRADSIFTHWRPLPKRDPDFSKLNKGDLICITYYPRQKFKIIGFFESVDYDSKAILLYSNNGAAQHAGGIYYVDLVDALQIMRINIGENKFEEI